MGRGPRAGARWARPRTRRPPRAGSGSRAPATGRCRRPGRGSCRSAPAGPPTDGATTGRPRRIGWLDLPMLQYATARSGMTHLIVTKMDILYGMENVKVCTAYDKHPFAPSDFKDAKPQYIEFPGWTNADSEKADYFLYYVGASANCEISYVSCGVEDKDIIKRAG